jgi:biotin carboxylase
MKVLFISPHYPEEMQDFTRGLAEVGAQVYGVGDTPRGSLPAKVQRHIRDYLQVPGLFQEDDALARIVAAARKLQIDRVECLWEPCIVLAARVREALGLPGMLPDVAIGFRDKPIMKERVAAAGLRVPRFARVSTAAEALAAAEEIGYPVIVKPIAGAGTADTYRADDPAELRGVLGAVGHHAEMNLEEFIDGEEFTYDTVCIDGAPVFESVAQYHPKPLEGRNNEWITPAQIVFRDPYQPALRDGIELGRGVLKALGMDTGFTHMEWYRKPDGEVVFGEIGARSPGGKLVDQMNFANDFDLYREWARTVCWRSFDARPHRRYHVAALFKRAEGQGRIRRVEGVDEIRNRLGDSLVVSDILPIGHPRRDWKQTLLSDGFMILRHPEYRECMARMNFAINHLRIWAG